jgi:hypothetical protein
MMRTRHKLFVSVGLVLCAGGCSIRTVVLDSQSDVVRLGHNVRGNVYVWQDGAWTKTGSVRLPEGWYAGPPPQ